jgi:hypothetical protein
MSDEGIIRQLPAGLPRVGRNTARAKTLQN